MTDTNQKLREALQAISHIDDTTNHTVDASAALDRIGQIARQALALRPEQVPMTCEPGEWNSIQIASWIGSKLMHEPPMFERATVCKFVRSLGRHPTLLKHSPKSHPAPSVPTADHIPDAGEMVVDHLPDAGKMIETAAPVGEREAFERTMMDKFGWERKDFKTDEFGYFDGHTVTAWMTWQARSALSAGDAVDAQMYRWLMDNCTLGIKQNGVGWSLNTTACIAPDCIKDVGATIDAAMRKGQL